MECPFCHRGPLRANETRIADTKNNIWCVRRQRNCLNCHRSFQTYEILADDFLHTEKYALILTGLHELLQQVPTRGLPLLLKPDPGIPTDDDE